MRSAVSSARVGAVDPGDDLRRARPARRRRRGTRRRTRRRRTRRRSRRRRRRDRRRTPWPRLANVPTLRWSAGTVAADVTSMPPMRSSATAIRTSAATASGSSPAASRRWRVSSASGWNISRRPRCRRRRRCRREVAAPLVASARGSRSGGGSRGSRCGPSPRRRRRRPPSARWSPPTSDRDGVAVAVDLAGEVVEHARPPRRATSRRGPRRRSATSSPARRRGGRRRAAAPAASSSCGSTRAGSSHARSRPSRVPATTPSVRLFDASRLAPCTPVQATSPTAYRPGSDGRAVEAGRHAAAREVGGRGDRDAVARRVDADLPAGLGDRREAGVEALAEVGGVEEDVVVDAGRAPRPCAG